MMCLAKEHSTVTPAWAKYEHLDPVHYSNHQVTILSLNPFHHNRIIYILHTLLFTFVSVVTMRISLTIKASYIIGNLFLYSHDCVVLL